MRMVFILAAAGSLAACASAKEQAVEQCAEQSAMLPDMVDKEAFCTCITNEIPDDASIEEAEQVLSDSASKCTNEAIQGAVSEMTAETAPAE
uniref:hypothetical protein n=1 Tax=Parerythrobacter lutipelagi TaxID=1964208 RepID=UPI0010F6B8CF|nr:hypothetical protein [Parerythrobacter lutipelagi]